MACPGWVPCSISAVSWADSMSHNSRHCFLSSIGDVVLILNFCVVFCSHPFSRARKKGFSFFSFGATPSRTIPKTQPLQVAFSLWERVDLRSQKEGILGKKVARGRVGRTGQKKEKRMHKKRWVDKLKEICTDQEIEAEFSVQVLGIRVASGVDTDFPYRVRIVDTALIAATLFAATVSDSQRKMGHAHRGTGLLRWRSMPRKFFDPRFRTIFPAFEHLRSTRSLASFFTQWFLGLFYARWTAASGSTWPLPRKPVRGPQKVKKNFFLQKGAFWKAVRGPPNSQLEGHRASLKMRRECGPWTAPPVVPEPPFKLVIFDTFVCFPHFAWNPYFYSVLYKFSFKMF